MVTSLMRTTREDSEVRRDGTPLQAANANQLFNNPMPTSSDLSREIQPTTNVSETDYVSATHWTAILENVGIPSRRTTSTYS